MVHTQPLIEFCNEFLNERQRSAENNGSSPKRMVFRMEKEYVEKWWQRQDHGASKDLEQLLILS